MGNEKSTESAMYEKVRDFVVTHWNANESLTFYDHGKHAPDGEGVTISFGGIRVEPDIYGVVSSGAFEIPLLGEGKREMGGKSGTTAVAQALAYRGLGMLAFVFFPESEFDNEAARFIETLCRQGGIGLLKVPDGDEPIRPKHVVLELPGGDPAGVADLYDRTLSSIKGLGAKNLGHVYPSSLRDFLLLFTQQRNSRADLHARFVREWKRFRSVLCERPYDPMVAKKLANDTVAKRDEYFDRFLSALQALGLVASRGGGFALRPWAEHIRFTTKTDERFQPFVSDDVARGLGIALLREFDQQISGLLATLRKAGMPISLHSYCQNSKCGHQGGNDSAWFEDTEDDVPSARCPKCNRKSVELGLWGRQWQDAGSWVSTLDYSMIKFAAAVGVLSRRRLPSWREDFPDLPTAMPNGEPIRWSYYWLGPILDSTSSKSLEQGDEDDDA